MTELKVKPWRKSKCMVLLSIDTSRLPLLMLKLYTIMLRLKSNSLDILSSVLYFSPSEYSVWIGFYDILPPHELFTWTNSCEILNQSAHGHSFPETSADMRCGASNLATATWRIDTCTEKKMFICESLTGIGEWRELKLVGVGRLELLWGKK